MNRDLIMVVALTTLKKMAFTLLCCVLMVFAAPAQTVQQIKQDPGFNTGSPPGAILNLTGTPIPGGGNSTYQQYTVNFTANISSTAITFAFREDPAFISFTNASVVDLSVDNGTNLLVNGDFSQGTVGSTPVGWTYANVYGALAGGIVESGSASCYTFNSCWYDGAVQAYDAISQTIPTTVGHNYQITFLVADNSSCSTDGGGPSCNFSDLSTNGDTTDPGGNGINVAVYAQAGLPPANQQLTVTLLDSGTGTVTDNFEAINCSETNGVVTGTCSANYRIGTVVTLTATAGSGSNFGGWGGACAGSEGTTCTVTMNSTQNVTASFVIPGQTQSGTVQLGQETVLTFGGGVPAGAYDYNAQLTQGSPVTANVTAIPVTDQTTCNTILQANPIFQGAQCFVFENASGANTPAAPVMFELTCPQSQGGTCGSIQLPTFFAELGTDFSFVKAHNVGYNPNNPLPGWVKGVGPDPVHPCTQNPNNNPPLFQSNQIDSYSVTGDPGTAKGGSGGTGSCWMLTYNTPGEAPSVNIVAPVNGGIYQQGQMTQANYTCTTVNHPPVNNIPNPTGPYLTQASCSAIDNPGGAVANTAQFDTNTLGLHTFTATVVDSATDNASQTVTYTVVGATDMAIANLARKSVPTGSKLTYLIGVGDLGNANGVNVNVTDTLDPGTTFLNASGTNVACSFVNGKFTCTTLPITCTPGNGFVSCNVGTILPLSFSQLNGAVIQVTVQVTAPAGTKQNPVVLKNTATVSEANADTKPGNNSSTASTTVTAH